MKKNIFIWRFIHVYILPLPVYQPCCQIIFSLGWRRMYVLTMIWYITLAKELLEQVWPWQCLAEEAGAWCTRPSWVSEAQTILMQDWTPSPVTTPILNVTLMLSSLTMWVQTVFVAEFVLIYVQVSESMSICHIHQDYHHGHYDWCGLAHLAHNCMVIGSNFQAADSASNG